MMPETTPVELTVPELSLLTDIIPKAALEYGEKADTLCNSFELDAARANLEVMRRLLDINQKFLDSLSGNPYGNLPVRRERLVSKLGLFTQAEINAAKPS